MPQGAHILQQGIPGSCRQSIPGLKWYKQAGAALMFVKVQNPLETPDLSWAVKTQGLIGPVVLNTAQPSHKSKIFLKVTHL